MRRLQVITLATVFAMCISCGSNNSQHRVADLETESVPKSGNGIYFWKSVFELNDYETDFLKRNNITQLYVKMFDVDVDRDWDTNQKGVYPVATTRFVSPKPQNVNIIPTVYITLPALIMMEDRETELARNIVTRVLAMVSLHDLGPVHAVQFDCDWTEGTENSYYNMCWEAKRMLKEHGIELSGTVRLHQLDHSYYPFDRTVLMLYNLGGLTNYNTHNSILDYNELKKYVKRGKGHKNMDFAYPTFSWGVLFRDQEFVALLHRNDFSNTRYFQPLNVNTYTVIEPITIEGHNLQKADVIRLETSDITEIIKTKERVENMLGEYPHHNIIYHLDSLNLSKYSSNEISSIYSF